MPRHRASSRPSCFRSDRARLTAVPGANLSNVRPRGGPVTPAAGARSTLSASAALRPSQRLRPRRRRCLESALGAAGRSRGTDRSCFTAPRRDQAWLDDDAGGQPAPPQSARAIKLTMRQATGDPDATWQPHAQLQAWGGDCREHDSRHRLLGVTDTRARSFNVHRLRVGAPRGPREEGAAAWNQDARSRISSPTNGSR